MCKCCRAIDTNAAPVVKEHTSADGSWPAQIINPNLWQPLSIYNAKTGVNVTQKFTTPQWLNVTSFALTCGTEFLSPAADIYQYGSLGYVAQARRALPGQPRSGCLLDVGGLGCWHTLCLLQERMLGTSMHCRSCLPDGVACTRQVEVAKHETLALHGLRSHVGVSGRSMSCWRSQRH